MNYFTSIYTQNSIFRNILKSKKTETTRFDPGLCHTISKWAVIERLKAILLASSTCRLLTYHFLTKTRAILMITVSSETLASLKPSYAFLIWTSTHLRITVPSEALAVNRAAPNFTPTFASLVYFQLWIDFILLSFLNVILKAMIDLAAREVHKSWNETRIEIEEIPSKY